MTGGTATYLPGETLGPRLIADYEIVWILAGDVTYHQNDNAHPAPPGSVILARPGFREFYEWDPSRNARHSFFHFNFTSMPDDWPPPAQWPICRQLSAGSPVFSLFTALLERIKVDRRSLNPPDRSVERIMETMLDQFIREPRQESQESQTHRPQTVRNALEWMNERVVHHADEPLTLHDVAQAAAVSSQHLCRLFAQHVGVSPMDAVRLLRLEQSVALLTRSNLNIKQIAARTGFASPYHFSRLFSKVYSCSPTELRKQIQAGAMSAPANPLWTKMHG
jgi:AraC family transcriptional regulator of arabinose operon